MKTIKILAAAAVASVALSAYAAGPMQYYVGGSVGHENMKLNHGGSNSGVVILANGAGDITNNADTPNTYFNLHFGALVPMNQMWSAGGQIGYTNYGQYEMSSVYKSITSQSGSIVESSQGVNSKSTISSVNLLAVVKASYDSFYVSPHAGVGYFMAKKSGGMWVYNASTLAVTQESGYNIHHLDPIAGLTAGYDINGNFGVYIEYNHVFGKNYKHNDSDARSNNAPTMDTYGVGINYTF